MADDKTAAEYEAARQSLRTLAESIRNGLPTFPDDAQMLYDTADMLTAVRRVTPDRETRAKLREVVAGNILGGANEHHCIENDGCVICAGNRAVDALLAAGVFVPAQPSADGRFHFHVTFDASNLIPAEQRTADRETIERALIEVERGAMTDHEWAILAPQITSESRHRQYADAVLAVLVPADQVIREYEERRATAMRIDNIDGEKAETWLARHDDQLRAETLREAHTIISKRRGTYEAGIDLMERVAELEAGLGA